ncbi:MAG: kelch repeat-containing protein, partial [Terracidiphilus sp.]
GTGLVLQNNGAGNLSISATGGFVFSTAVDSGGTYRVSVLTQPSNPDQTCTVTNGSGSASANITSVLVSCAALHNVWTWVGGSSAAGAAGVYGTQGVAAASNIPGARALAVSGTDGSGNFWLFGGATGDSSGIPEEINDLWKYSPSSGEWTWIDGSSQIDQVGSYGTKGTATTGNIPGSRFDATGSVDSSGNLWVFGGVGYTPASFGVVNDLWKYSAGEWTWVSGSDVISQGGIYGNQGVADPGNVPLARYDAVSWTDAAGNFWLFGGVPWWESGFLNDLWKYDPTTGEWTWMSGSQMTDRNGVYGTEGAADSGNIPGTRALSVSWTDLSGNLWLFGGFGYDSLANIGTLNDLWKYSPTSGEWTYMGGSESNSSSGSFGTQGSALSANSPSARQGASGWTDASGNFWLFGGLGQDSTGTAGSLSDLWKYSGGAWTWVSGSKSANQSGIYGSKGTAALSNAPGARAGAMIWIDSSGDLWLFGGNSTETAGSFIGLNDLWEYTP